MVRQAGCPQRLGSPLVADLRGQQDGDIVGVDFNFNGWGNKQIRTNDAQVGHTLLAKYDIPRRTAPLVAEECDSPSPGRLLIDGLAG
ncbi:hypothetical protein GCM10010207_60190 [Streptomyces atratus]|nr:hypothetical protein GCM10010207_60190 [Streptomyces atratus]